MNATKFRARNSDRIDNWLYRYFKYYLLRWIIFIFNMAEELTNWKKKTLEWTALATTTKNELVYIYIDYVDEAWSSQAD